MRTSRPTNTDVRLALTLAGALALFGLFSACDSDGGSATPTATPTATRTYTATASPTATPDTPLTLRGTVADVALSARVITLDQPVVSITAIALTEGTQLAFADGRPAELRDFEPGMEIEAVGRQRTPGSLIAENVTIVAAGQSARQFALVQDVARGQITFDRAEFLTGDEALRAAREDGFIGPNEDLPNNFYVRNQDTETEALPVSDDFQAVLIDSTTIGPAEPIDYRDFEALFAGEMDAAEYYGFVSADFPMNLEQQNGQLVRASQQYVP